MLRHVSRFLEALLIRCGLAAPRWIHQAWWLLRYGRWLRSMGNVPVFGDREELYAHLLQRLGADPFLYLEFGVAGGDSFRYWLGAHRHDRTRFVGFDTFDGLPQPWHRLTFSYPCGQFTAGGRPPDVGDGRARFLVGPFQKTLPQFALTLDHSLPLVVHLDADLFPSTLFVLTTLHQFLIAGTILVFDDFGIADHDFRAFLGYTEAYCRCSDSRARPSGGWPWR